MFQIAMTDRREFLVRGLGLVGLSAAVPGFLIRTALAGPETQNDDSILVVVQLSGGNDGLSTVVPYADDDYGRARSATRIATSDVHKLNDEIGLHPALAGFKELHDKGSLALIQGVGYPNPNQSHFTSMDIWHAADPAIREESGPTGSSGLSGWLGKYCDHAYRDRPEATRAIAVGFNQAPRALQGRQHGGLAVQGAGGFRFFVGNGLDRNRSDLMTRLARVQPAAPGNADLDFVSQTITTALAAGEQISNLALQYRTTVNYPFNIPLAVALRTVAALIASSLPTRVFYVYQDGYDTHAGQKTRHDKLMADLNAAVVAFQKDLDRQGSSKRVLMMTMSEFGRRVFENGSQGTDHGTAAPLFLISPAIKGGVHGKHPSLAKDDLLLARDLKFAIDFRSVYATVLEKWLKTPSKPVLGVQMPLIDCLS